MKNHFAASSLSLLLLLFSISCKDSKNSVPIQATIPTYDWEGEVGKYNDAFKDSVLFNSTRYIGTSFAPSVNIMHKNGSGIHAMVNDWFTFAACWSPRKWKIFYLRDSSFGRAEPGLYLMNADGSNKKRLSPTVDRVWGISCSPDGRKIACIVLNDVGQGKLRIADPDYSNQSDITGFFGANEFHTVTWSPDSKRVAYDGVYSSNGKGAIGYMQADGTSGGILFEYSSQCWEPAWCPDGKKVAFVSFFHPDSNYYVELFSYNLQTSQISRLTNNVGFCQKPCWSPDGTKIMFSSRGIGDSPDHLVVMNSDGSGLLQLTNASESDWDPAW